MNIIDTTCGRRTARFAIPLCVLLLSACAHHEITASGTTPVDHAPPPESVLAPGGVHLFELTSTCLTEFWGRPVTIQAGVVLPPSYERGRDYPICYSIHGFGGSHRGAWRTGPQLVESMKSTGYPEMVYVFLNAQFPMGHHEFADSANNGPWGHALTTEFLPALEFRYVPGATSRNRFLTGHSSGGWSSLWLQYAYPDVFNGTWSTAPDSVDFRDFTGIDVYRFASAFSDPDGEPIQLMRRDGEWAMTLQSFVVREREREPLGGQFYSFNAVFSPRAEDGTPQQLFDWETGKIDPAVADTWKKYDIAYQLRTRWDELAPRLSEKIHVYIGDQDTFRLEGALKLMKADLARVGSDADIIVVEGRDHGSLFRAHEELWPQGMMARIHQEMMDRFAATR